MRPIILSLSVLVLLAACKKEPTEPEVKNPPAEEKTPPPLNETWLFQWEGMERSCLVHVPSSQLGQAGSPTVFDLHGYGGTAVVERDYTQTHVLGDSVGFITVYPLAFGLIWNSGIGDNPSFPTFNTDDVGFISRIIDSLISRFKIDSLRVYSCGFSNGGFMSLKLAGQLSNRIAAVASVSGVLANSTAAAYVAARPVPVLMIHGTGDAVVPYGGESGWYSVDQTINFWILKNNATLPAETLFVADRDPQDESTVVRYSYGSPSNLSKVVLFKLIDGGHRWPGALPVPSYGDGITNNDINARNEIWDFFKQFSLAQ